MQNKGDIGLGDLLIALSDLPWQRPEHAQAIVTALGFNWRDQPLAQTDVGQGKKIFDRSRYQDRPPTRPSQNKPSRFSAPPAPKPPLDLPTGILNSTLKPLPTTAVDAIPPDWINHKNVFLTQDNNPTKVKENTMPARANLFPSQTHRGILSAALRIRKRGKEPNIPKLIAQVVRGKIPAITPTRECFTLQRGCQLLLDYSQSMVPFWDDLRALAKQVENLVGAERIARFEFDQNPNLSKQWLPTGQSQSWHIDRSRPLLIASDLGIAGQVGQYTLSPDWLTFINACSQQRVPLLILIPWQAQYWPTNISQFPILIHWNPHTTATMVKKLVGNGHGVMA
jgi:hypothetical protein